MTPKQSTGSAGGGFCPRAKWPGAKAAISKTIAGVSCGRPQGDRRATPPSLERIESALSVIPADDRDTWLKVGMALKAELGESGFSIWDNWSQQAASYRERDARDVWRSIHAGKITIGTLFFLGRRHGWRPGLESMTLSPAEIEQRRQHRLDATTKERVMREAGHQAAKRSAERRWRLARPVASNRYLAKKHVQSHGLRAQGDLLLIPMRDRDGELWNIQTIDLIQGKRFLPGSRVLGLFHMIGNPTDSILIAEGYATGATVHEHTGLQTFVAFDCGNLIHVARIARDLNPGKRITICADNDRRTPGNPGVTKARAAALAIGGYVAVPRFPESVPGTDFNDLHVYRRALVEGVKHGGA